MKTTRIKRSARVAPGSDYRVFVSHAGDDIWLAKQIAKCLETCGVATFLDRRNIAAGDSFKVRIREEMPKCQELLALFTPWSRRRAWVRHEIGMADMLGKRIVCVFYRSRSGTSTGMKMALDHWTISMLLISMTWTPISRPWQIARGE